MRPPKVALFATCLVTTYFPELGKAAIQLLQQAGCQVELAPKETCCGAPVYVSGQKEQACRIARQTLKTFQAYDAIICPSPSCAAMLRTYPSFIENADELAEKTFELTDYLVHKRHFTDFGARLPAKAVYHASCHEKRVPTAPIPLLKGVKELSLLPLPSSSICCGFGGALPLFMPSLALQITDDKVSDIIETGASHLIGIDGACLMNLATRIRKRGLPIQVLHIAEVLTCR
jgi:L-lactate dehydrogenase complex protein LldE